MYLLILSSPIHGLSQKVKENVEDCTVGFTIRATNSTHYSQSYFTEQNPGTKKKKKNKPRYLAPNQMQGIMVKAVFLCAQEKEMGLINI